MKSTVPLPAVKIPRLPLISSPAMFNVPAPEKIIRELTPAEVILPETVTVPVEIVRSVYRPLPPEVPAKAIDAADKEPPPTAITVLMLSPAGAAVVQFVSGRLIQGAHDRGWPPVETYSWLHLGFGLILAICLAIYMLTPARPRLAGAEAA